MTPISTVCTHLPDFSALIDVEKLTEQVVLMSEDLEPAATQLYSEFLLLFCWNSSQIVNFDGNMMLLAPSFCIFEIYAQK